MPLRVGPSSRAVAEITNLITGMNPHALHNNYSVRNCKLFKPIVFEVIDGIKFNSGATKFATYTFVLSSSPTRPTKTGFTKFTISFI